MAAPTTTRYLSPLVRAALAGLAALVAGGAASPAQAQTDVALEDSLDPRTADDLYCTWLDAEADAEAALLVAPEAFLSAGVTRTTGSVPDELVTDPDSEIHPRLLSGLRYRFANLRRRNLVYEQARAHCVRNRADSELSAALTWGSDVGRREALEAQRASLSASLDEARELAADVEQRLAAREATLLQRYTTGERLDGLTEALSDVELALYQLELRPALPEGAPSELVDTYLEADRDVLRAQHALDRARAWELELRAEYDWVIGDETGSDELPLAVSLRATFNFGRLFQGGAQSRAERAREGYLRAEETELRSRVARLTDSLNDQLAEEEGRLAELEELAAALDEQLALAAESDSTMGRELYLRLWFDAAELRAERSGLEARVEALERFVAASN